MALSKPTEQHLLEGPFPLLEVDATAGPLALVGQNTGLKVCSEWLM